MKSRKVFEAMQGAGLISSVVGVCGWVANLKKIATANTEVEVEQGVKKAKLFETIAGVGAITTGIGTLGDMLTMDKMSVEEMEEMERKVKAEVAKELEEEEEDEDEDEIIVDDSDIEI